MAYLHKSVLAAALFLAISPAMANNTVPTITPQALAKNLDQITLKGTTPICTVQIMNGPGYHDMETVPNPGTCAMRISYSDLAHTYYRQLPEKRKIVIYSQHGKLGEKATAFLQEHGYPEAVNLEGGLTAWRKLHYRLP